MYNYAGGGGLVAMLKAGASAIGSAAAAGSLWFWIPMAFAAICLLGGGVGLFLNWYNKRTGPIDQRFNIGEAVLVTKNGQTWNGEILDKILTGDPQNRGQVLLNRSYYKVRYNSRPPWFYWYERAMWERFCLDSQELRSRLVVVPPPPARHPPSL